MTDDSSMNAYDIPYYLDYLPAALLKKLEENGESVDGVPGLKVAPGLAESFPKLESAEALSFVCELYRRTRAELRQVLEQRRADRDFIDKIVADAVETNASLDYLSPEYKTPLGHVDAHGRVVIGPLKGSASTPRTEVKTPDFLK